MQTHLTPYVTLQEKIFCSFLFTFGYGTLFRVTAKVLGDKLFLEMRLLF